MNNDTIRFSRNQLRRPVGFSPWENLTYLQKFTVVALIFALSLFAFLPLILDQNTRIENYGRKEAQGAVYLGFMWRLSSDLQSLQIASIDLNNGLAKQAQVNDALVKVEADIIALESASRQYNPALGIDFDIKEISNKWAALRVAIQEGQSKDIDAGYITLSNSINNLVAQTGDKSYLILDPDLDTYYEMDTVLLTTPENKDLTFQIWQIANEAAVAKEISPENQFQLSVLTGRLKSNLNRMEQNLQTSIKSNKNGVVEPIISAPLERYLASSQSFMNLVNTYLSAPSTTQLSAIVLKASYLAVRDSNEAFYAAASDALGKGIQTRIQSLSLRLYFSILLAVLSTLIAYMIGSRIMRTISLPLINLLSATQKLTDGEMDTRIPVTSTDEAGQVALAFNALAEELQSNRQILQARADELERRSAELEAIAEVARDISTIRDLNTMLNVASSLIRERFNFYHTGIFLADERNEYSILRAANGPAAQSLLEQGYKLRIGAANVVGHVIQTGVAQITTFTENDNSPSKNMLLPETRSEIGLPLKVRSLTIGVLDIHSKSERAFTKREIQIFQILADQISAAVDNAQLAEQVEGTINRLNTANRAQTKRNWENVLGQKNLAFAYDGFQIQAVPQNLPGQLMGQLESGKPIIIKQDAENHGAGKPAQNTLMVPIVLSGQVIGVIGLEKEKLNSDWTSEEISIAEAAANRAAITLENARLLDESQRLATKERAISEATSRISTALSMETILGITAEELERVVGDSEVILQIQPDGKPSPSE